MLGGVVLAAPAMACEPAIDPWNNLVAFSDDGSFVNADRGPGQFGRDTVSGAPVADLGGGLVSQVVSAGTVCSFVEYLVVTACFDGRAIALMGTQPIHGPDEEPSAGFGGELVQEILAPRGKIRVDVSSTIESLTAAAELNDIRYVVKGSEGDQWAPWDSYPMRRACKLFYPGSPGSK